uniref:Uncharacterized protein n=1 Tax=Zea mays TaxID=4577 RepID=A0A804NNH3_MAIZE
MDGDAFDLNSQAPETDGFPGLQLYGNILSDSDGLFDGRASGSVLPPYRPPCAEGGDARAAAAAPYARQLLFDAPPRRQATQFVSRRTRPQQHPSVINSSTTQRVVAPTAKAHRVRHHRGHRGLRGHRGHPGVQR